MNLNRKKIIAWSIKGILFVLTTIIIWGKLSDNTNFTQVSQLLSNLNNHTTKWVLSMVFLLMLFNWLAESLKWRLLIDRVEHISYFTAVQSVFCGLSLGIITPNRVGEYASRMFFLRPRKRVFGLVAMGLGAYAQFVFTNVVAAVAISIFLYYYKGVHLYWVIAFFAAAIIYCGVLMLSYFNIQLIKKPLNKFKFTHRFVRFLSVISDYKKSFLGKILLISALKLLILVVQYYLIIHLLIPDVGFAEVALMIVMLFSAQTVIPTFDLLDIGVRGVTAMYFFSFITEQEIAILASTTLIWFINLIIPGFIGVFFIYKLKIFDKKNTPQTIKS